jgi:hypothetical protein
LAALRLISRGVAPSVALPVRLEEVEVSSAQERLALQQLDVFARLRIADAQKRFCTSHILRWIEWVSLVWADKTTADRSVFLDDSGHEITMGQCVPGGTFFLTSLFIERFD